ncbi:MAG: helix-turn-helix domain-containing protein [Bacteroidota bacterium]
MVFSYERTSIFSVNPMSMQGSKDWLQRLNAIIEQQLDDPSLNNLQLAQALTVSERHLFRKVKALTGMSPQKYLNQYRLQRALRHLETGTYRTVKETSFAVGFRSTSYFIRQFERQFGKKPLQVLQDAGWR